MAQRTIRIDDLDGSTEEARSISFALEGTTYDIDLSEAHINQLRQVMSPFVAVARPRKKAASFPSGGGTQPARIDKEQLNNIRRWAHAHGYEFSDRGRIPNRIMEAYEKLAYPAAKAAANGNGTVVVPTFTG